VSILGLAKLGLHDFPSVAFEVLCLAAAPILGSGV
jgi:hypothetical protein